MSSKSIFVLSALLVSASAIHAQMSAPAYAPGSHRYRITRESQSTQEVMGNVQSGTITTYEEVTLDLRAAGRDTMRFSFTIDSSSRQTNIEGAPDVPPMKGRKVGGRISSRGVFQAFDADSASANDISAGYRGFLPQLPTAQLRAGMTWVDTLKSPFTQAGIEGTTMSVISSRVVGDTTIGDQKAWRVERTATLSMSGTGNQNGADLLLSGTGSATGVSLFGANGVYFGGTSTQSLALTVEVPAASMSIPIKQNAVTKVERVGAPAGR